MFRFLPSIALKRYYTTRLHPFSSEYGGISLEVSLMTELKSKLELLKHFKCHEKEDEDSKVTLVKSAVRDYLVKSQQSQSSLSHVVEQLRELHERECLITEPAIYKWALQLASEIVVQLPDPDSSTDQGQESSEIRGPLFCKDTVYHASICSLAVNTHDAGNYLKFFKNKEMVPGYSFEEFSISRSKQDRYLIARQGESTYYIAFQSEELSRWPKLFKSFKKGRNIYLKCHCRCKHLYMCVCLTAQG